MPKKFWHHIILRRAAELKANYPKKKRRRIRIKRTAKIELDKTMTPMQRMESAMRQKNAENALKLTVLGKKSFKAPEKKVVPKKLQHPSFRSKTAQED